MEVFVPFLGFEGLYEISNLGRIKSFRHKKPRILKARREADREYWNVTMTVNSKPYIARLHREVGRHFLPHTGGFYYVCHKDEELTGAASYALDNLFVGTPRANLHDCMRKGRWRAPHQKSKSTSSSC